MRRNATSKNQEQAERRSGPFRHTLTTGAESPAAVAISCDVKFAVLTGHLTNAAVFSLVSCPTRFM
jgi:hypothetical protein